MTSRYPSRTNQMEQRGIMGTRTQGSRMLDCARCAATIQAYHDGDDPSSRLDENPNSTRIMKVQRIPIRGLETRLSEKRICTRRDEIGCERRSVRDDLIGAVKCRVREFICQGAVRCDGSRHDALYHKAELQQPFWKFRR
jgi:hypothetical protein